MFAEKQGSKQTDGRKWKVPEVEVKEGESKPEVRSARNVVEWNKDVYRNNHLCMTQDVELSDDWMSDW